MSPYETLPYGYEPPVEQRKGTLIYYDSFEQTMDEQLDLAAKIAEDRAFAKLVLYPLHEETVRRMTKELVSPFYKRDDRLHEWKRERGHQKVAIDSLEGKRKKYTPIDSALRHLTEAYASPPFFVRNARDGKSVRFFLILRDMDRQDKIAAHSGAPVFASAA